MKGIRQKRVAEQIRSVLSELLLREVRDPRIANITIMEAQVDRELQFADIYVHALGDDSRQDEALAGLNNAAGYLRSQLARRLKLRAIPRLHFHWDPTAAQADRVYAILDELAYSEEE